MPEFHAAARTIQIGVYCAANWSSIDVQTQDVTRSYIWIVNQMSLVSVLKFKALVTTKDHVTAMDLGCNQGPFWSQEVMLMLSPCQFEKTVLSVKPKMTSGSNLLLMAMVWVHEPATVLCLFMTGAHANHLLNHVKNKRHPEHPCTLVA